MNLHRTETGAPQRKDIPRELWNIWQKIAERTNDIITPANLLDIAALGAEVYVNQGLILGGHETMQNTTNEEEFIKGAYEKIVGLILDQPLLLVDFADGSLAQKTGTASRVGEIADFIGDALKAALKLKTRYQIGEMGVGAVMAIAGPKVVNLVTSGIRTLRGEMVRPTLTAKLAEWPRGAAFLAHDLAEIIKTLDQVDLVKDGITLDEAKNPTTESEMFKKAKLTRDVLTVGAAAIGSAASIENISSLIK